MSLLKIAFFSDFTREKGYRYTRVMVPKVFAIVNQKGGVGKTTTTINVASNLSDYGKKVLLVDLDPQGNATSGVGVKSDQVGQTIYDLLCHDASLEDCLYPTPFENLHLLPATKDLAGAEVEMVQIVSRETLLKKVLAPLRDYYDFILIDCPPSLGLLTLNALVSADRAIIPVQCEYYALEGVAGLVNTLKLVQESYNPDLQIAGIVMTMYDQRTMLNRQVVHNTKSFFKDMVFETIIPRNIRLSEAPSHGLPISLYAADSKGAQAYSSLAKEVMCCE